MLSENLKRLRLEKEYSRRKLAEISGLTQKNIQDIEDGRNTNPTLKTLLGLSKGLNVSISKLIKD